MTFRYWWIVLSIGLVIHGVPGGPSPRVSAQQGTVLEALTWDLGDRWTWQRGPDQITATVVGVAGGYALQVMVGSEMSMAHFESDFSSPSGDDKYLALQFPLAVGKTWSYEIAGTYDGKPVKWRITRKVEAMESVAVPAGTFDTVRVSGHHCNIVLGGCADYASWYGPKAKQVVKLTWSNASYWLSRNRGATQALISYQLNHP